MDKVPGLIQGTCVGLGSVRQTHPRYPLHTQACGERWSTRGLSPARKLGVSVCDGRTRTTLGRRGTLVYGGCKHTFILGDPSPGGGPPLLTRAVSSSRLLRQKLDPLRPSLNPLCRPWFRPLESSLRTPADPDGPQVRDGTSLPTSPRPRLSPH